MKKHLFFLALAFAGMTMSVSCHTDIEHDIDILSLIDFEGDYWDGLVDNQQYGGDLLYGPADENWCYNSDYKWNDEKSGLAFEGFPESWGSLSFSGGGEAVSNYVNADYAGADYLRQLEVPAAPEKGKNFVVHYGSGEPYPMLRFTDGYPHKVLCMNIIMTSYLADAAINGNSWFGPLSKEGSFIGVRMIGFDQNGNRCGSVEKVLVTTEDVPLYKNGSKKVEWQSWNTAELGYIYSFAFEVYGSGDCYDEYGLSAPAYFAYDVLSLAKNNR